MEVFIYLFYHVWWDWICLLDLWRETDSLSSSSHVKVWRQKNPATSDPVYHNWLVNMSVNWILKNGKKSLAFQIIYWALKRIQKKTIKSINCFTRGSARSNSWSNSKSKAHGCIYPSSSNWSRNITRKINRYPLLVGGILKHQGQNMVLKLSSEAMDGAKENGEAIR